MDTVISRDSYAKIPMVEAFMKYGIEPDLAEYAFESLLRKNPFYALLNIEVNESLLYSDEDPFFDTFLEAYKLANGDEKLFAEVLVYESPQQVVEGVMSDVADKAKAAGGAIADGASQLKRGVERTANAVKHVVNPIVDGIHKTIIGYQQQTEEEKRQMIISGSIFYKLRYLFKKILHLWFTKEVMFALLPGGFLGLILRIPAYLAGAVMLLRAGHSTYKVATGDAASLEQKTKNRVIQELELELKMCREKIEDARSAGDRQKKYQLMRVENKIEQELMRIKYSAVI